MDILISSNLERLLYLLTGKNDVETREKMDSLRRTGVYQLDGCWRRGTASPAAPSALRSTRPGCCRSCRWGRRSSPAPPEFSGGCCDDRQAADTIRETFERYSYLCDPHTAVAVKVWEDYRKETSPARMFPKLPVGTQKFTCSPAAISPSASSWQ